MNHTFIELPNGDGLSIYKCTRCGEYLTDAQGLSAERLQQSIEELSSIGWTATCEEKIVLDVHGE